jgi:hypothetical protein
MKKILFPLGVLLALIIISFSFVFFTTPTSIAFPKKDHYHFRSQVIIDGALQNFSDPQFQAPLVDGLCDGTLSPQPFHFHDKKNQIAHVHWQGVTGGQWLKFYGYNQIGGNNNDLGLRLDKLFAWPMNFETVPVYNQEFAKAKTTTLWVFKGDETGFSKASTSDFLSKDLNEFFGKYSEGRKLQSSNTLTAFAHNGVDDGDGNPNDVRTVNSSSTSSTLTKGQLEKLNDFVGNVVIFIQKDEPTQEQVKERFNNLEPLSDSVCGG